MIVIKKIIYNNNNNWAPNYSKLNHDSPTHAGDERSMQTRQRKDGNTQLQNIIIVNTADRRPIIV